MISAVFSGWLEEIPLTHSYFIHGINFSNVCLIRLSVDNVPLDTRSEFSDSLVVFHQLQESALRPGNYLLFTCVCGVADDAGWGKISVTHSNGSVGWKFARDEKMIHFSFDQQEYSNTIHNLQHQIHDAQGRGLRLEPSHVIFPES